MARLMTALIAYVLLAYCAATGSWRDVEPFIQSIKGDHDTLVVDHILITYGADTLQFCAQELQRELQSIGITVDTPTRITEDTYFGQDSLTPLRSIHLSWWSDGSVINSVFPRRHPLQVPRSPSVVPTIA